MKYAFFCPFFVLFAVRTKKKQRADLRFFAAEKGKRNGKDRNYIDTGGTSMIVFLQRSTQKTILFLEGRIV